MNAPTRGSTSAEQQRVAADSGGAGDWRAWGPYVAERAWGTVREDYLADGEAWTYLPHDHARSRAYRWSEDGMAAVCDTDQRICLGLTLWNGNDPILKERMFGLDGHEGNHGEDAKEYWWYLDSTPTHSWMTWRYHYPQVEFPYQDLGAGNAARGRREPEYELLDTGVFADDRFWEVTVDYAKDGPDDVLMRIRARNRGPDAAELHVLPSVWFRNTWAWDDPSPPTPRLSVRSPSVIQVAHPDVSPMVLTHAAGQPQLFCDNETNTERLFGVAGRSRFPKDGIGDHVIHGAATTNPEQMGTKAAVHHRVSVEPGETAEIRVRLSPGADAADIGEGFESVMTRCATEADEFYADLTPPGSSADEASLLRQAMAGLLWGKQFFHYDVARWLEGDPTASSPDPIRSAGRNSHWWHLEAADIISVPDPWEYPWFAAWDLAFHAVPLAHVDPGFAKSQLLLMLSERYMHPNGQLPAYEWAFGDVNPPVHAWAALQVFHCTGGQDYEFLERMFHRLLINFTWWVNRKDSRGANVFEGGFLGLDNIGAFDRSTQVPPGGRLVQSDGTAWMAMFCLDMLEMSLVLAEHDSSYEAMASKFFQHFAYIGFAAQEEGVWDESDGFFYDVLTLGDERRMPLRVRSAVGLLPLTATTTLGTATLRRLPQFASDFTAFLERKPKYAHVVGATHSRDGHEGRLLSMVSGPSLTRILERMLDTEEFLSPHGIRSLSRSHSAEPFTMELNGQQAAVGYEPAESESGLFGGNSNWRGPVWLPLNVLLLQGLLRFARFYGDDFTVELPTGSGNRVTLQRVADDIAERLISLFLRDSDGRRPSNGGTDTFDFDPGWAQAVTFSEFFHGDTGAGLGASHQTGWTALVAELLLHRHPDPDTG